MTMKKVVIAIDSFKGCLSSSEANEAVAEALENAERSSEKYAAVCVPVSDGGEGMTEAFKAMNMGFEEVSIPVHGPLMEPITASYLISEDHCTAIMEMASACGLPLVPLEKRNPEKTTTYGFGEMLNDAITRGCKRIIIGIGGSSTCDAGEGMMNALRDNGTDFKNIVLSVACDVQNPLFGPDGAAFVFAPQKGAYIDMVVRLDEKLRAIYKESGCNDSIPGDGAAGGLGFALRYYLGAKLKPGIDVVLDALNFDQIIEDANLIITGEGKCDRQTLMGKVPFGILNRAKKHQIPTVLLAGKVEDRDLLISEGFSDVICINQHDNRDLEILMQPQVAKQNIKYEIQSYCS